MSQRLQQVAGCLDLFAAPAFLTDPYNRLLRVNQKFARMVGAPIQDRLPAPVRFIPAAMIGPYRERFPRALQELGQCLPSIPHEVTAEGLLAFCRGRIAGYKIPKSITFQREPLPKSGPGKVLKRERRQPCWEAYERHVN